MCSLNKTVVRNVTCIYNLCNNVPIFHCQKKLRVETTSVITSRSPPTERFTGTTAGGEESVGPHSVSGR